MVERFHRQLNASLTARLTRPNCDGQLPWVLLGIRAAHKDGIDASPAEMVYGTELHLPGQFWAPAAGKPTAGQFLDDLRRAMAELRPTPNSHHQPTEPHPTNIPEDLRTCPIVFIRCDRHRTPLSARYDGPYRVLEGRQILPPLARRQGGHRGDRPVEAGHPGARHPSSPATKMQTSPSTTAGPAAKTWISSAATRLPPAPTPGSPTGQEPSTTQQTPARRTRSGRTIRTPQRYVSNVGGG